MVLFGISTPLINYMFCFFISVISFIYYKKQKNQLLFFISFAFYFLGFSHFAKLVGLENKYFIGLVILRFIAYNLLVIGLLKAISQKILLFLIISISFFITISLLWCFNLINLTSVVPFVNLTFSIIILVLSIVLYKKERNIIPLFFIISYSFFTISRILAVFKFEINVPKIIITFITIGYFVLFIMFLDFIRRDISKLIKNK